MTEAEASRTRPGAVALGLLLLAALTTGCSDSEYGSVAASPEAVKAEPSKKGGPIPRVPRGPDQAKALQDAKGK